VASRPPPQGEIEVPRQFPSVPPPDASAWVAQTRLIVKAVEDSVGDLKSDVKDIKAHRHSDFVYHVSVFAGGFLLLAGMMIVGYLRLDEKMSALSSSSIRVDTKLEDLLQRIPPVQALPPSAR
jgi:hypothetical protein